MALAYGIFRRAVMDWCNDTPQAVRFATKPFPSKNGDPCAGCKHTRCDSATWPDCARYGIGFDSLEQEIETYWYGPLGTAIRTALGAEDFSPKDIECGYQAEDTGASRVLPHVGAEDDLGEPCALEAGRRW